MRLSSPWGCLSQILSNKRILFRILNLIYSTMVNCSGSRLSRSPSWTWLAGTWLQRPRVISVTQPSSLGNQLQTRDCPPACWLHEFWKLLPAWHPSGFTHAKAPKGKFAPFYHLKLHRLDRYIYIYRYYNDLYAWNKHFTVTVQQGPHATRKYNSIHI